MYFVPCPLMGARGLFLVQEKSLVVTATIGDAALDDHKQFGSEG
jgi:hypothetical protein